MKKLLNLFLFLLITGMLLAVSFIACTNENNDEKVDEVISAPRNVKAIVNGITIRLEWDHNEDAQYYSIHKYVNGNKIHAASGPELYYVDYTPQFGTNTYSVYAHKYESTSNESRVECWYDNGGGSTGLSAPSGLNATKGATSVILSWNSVSSAVNYYVYRSSSATGVYSELRNIAYTQTEDTSPLKGDNYYKVKAFDGTNYSDFSNYVYINFSTSGGDVTKPSAPSGVTVSNEGSVIIPMIAIRWNSVSGATGYKIYRSTSASGTYSQIGTATNTVFVDDNPREGTSYYKVKATNSAGESEFSSYASLTYNANDVSPCPVTYGSCTVSGVMMTIRWTVPKTTGCGTPTKTYLRVRNPLSGVYADVQTLSATATSASFNYTGWVDSNGYVYVGIITENNKGTSGGTPKIYDNKGGKWIN